jgi:hypothetical protein
MCATTLASDDSANTTSTSFYSTKDESIDGYKDVDQFTFNLDDYETTEKKTTNIVPKASIHTKFHRIQEMEIGSNHFRFDNKLTQKILADGKFSYLHSNQNIYKRTKNQQSVHGYVLEKTTWKNEHFDLTNYGMDDFVLGINNGTGTLNITENDIIEKEIKTDDLKLDDWVMVQNDFKANVISDHKGNTQLKEILFKDNYRFIVVKISDDKTKVLIASNYCENDNCGDIWITDKNVLHIRKLKTDLNVLTFEANDKSCSMQYKTYRQNLYFERPVIRESKISTSNCDEIEIKFSPTKNEISFIHNHNLIGKLENPNKFEMETNSRSHQIEFCFKTKLDETKLTTKSQTLSASSTT